MIIVTNILKIMRKKNNLFENRDKFLNYIKNSEGDTRFYFKNENQLMLKK